MHAHFSPKIKVFPSTQSKAVKQHTIQQNMHLHTLICPAPCPPSRRCIPTATRLLPTATPARKKSGRRLHTAGQKLRQTGETLRETECDIKGQRSSGSLPLQTPSLQQGSSNVPQFKCIHVIVPNLCSC